MVTSQRQDGKTLVSGDFPTIGAACGLVSTAGYSVLLIGGLVLSPFMYRGRFERGALVVSISSLAFGIAGLISSMFVGVDGFVYGAISIGWLGSICGGLFYWEIFRRHS